MNRILTVVGTRPNIIKITQFNKVANAHPSIEHKLVHTGQHYNHNMSDVFFEELELEKPDFSFDANRDTVVIQIAEIMKGLEKVIDTYQPDIMNVVGDVNSTCAAALVANKKGITLTHIESGLRSFDRTMPEEHNRMVTDVLADIYFVTEESGKENLLKEGKPESAIHFVGNTMIDSLVAYDDKIKASTIIKKLEIQPKSFALMTIHRPGNVDTKEGLHKLIEVIEHITEDAHVVFPIHPRTRNRFAEFGLNDRIEKNKQLILLEPIGYLDFQNLVLNAQFVITDSGGIQEETTFRQVPCLTLRPNTERPVTTSIGSNTLLPFETSLISEQIDLIRNGNYKKGEVPPLWDGKATERIFGVLSRY